MAVDTLRTEEAVDMVEKGDIIERDRKLDVAGMTGARPRVLTTCSTPKKFPESP